MKHEIVEKNVGLLAVLILVAISFGGLAEVVPLFFQKQTTEPVEGLRPLTALELEGRDIYRREGCVGCHSQMVRPFRAETERYGHYNVAGGGRYSDDWHRAHMYNPRDVVPESIMPAYPWLFERTLDGEATPRKMRVLRQLGVPYTDEDIANATAEVRGQQEITALVAYLQQLGTVLEGTR